ncbi:MAG: FAD-dependent monooxygenase [Desulfovibrionaceae bacterium]|jgi:salicylate hydroxylase|nr:FAD-dependent monooxygenase [Desulfovibrionaceae bacterium]
MSTAPQLLIVGGGIGGLAAALAVSRAGVQARLFERAPAFGEVSAGIQLGPNATRILCGWGLERELAAAASFPERLQIRDAVSGAELGVLPLGREAFDRYGAPHATIHRADLHRLLCAAVMSQAEVHINLAHGMDRFHDDGKAVTLTTTAGKQIEGDALLGADGAWGRVRQQLLGDQAPRLTGLLAYRAMLNQPALPAALRGAQITVWLGPRLHVAQYPVRGGQWMSVAAIARGQPPGDMQTWNHDANAAALRQAAGAVCAPLRDLLDAAPAATVNEHAWRLWPLADRAPVRSADQLARGCVALLGDAAHPMRPYLTQGAGMAIEDAAELARALVMDVVDVPIRLLRYAQARWQRVARVQAQSTRSGHLFHAAGLVRAGRDAAIRLLGARLLDLPWLYGERT